MTNSSTGPKKNFDDLVALMALLRSEDGCPWDRAQTHESIKHNLIEETYEVVDAIDAKDSAGLREELGDLLIQVVFHSRMAEEAGNFDITDVVSDINEKITRRHPHIFADSKVQTSGEVLDQWDTIKREKEGKSLFDSIPTSLPSLQYAQKVQNKVARVGFDWTRSEEIFDKIIEEIHELKAAFKDKIVEEVEDEIGDIIFSLVNLARHMDLDSEQLLRKNVGKFKARFRHIERALKADGLEPADVDLNKLEELWQKSKEERYGQDI